jgi:hypothetical protein
MSSRISYERWYAAIEHFERLQQRRAASERIEEWERTVRLGADWLNVPARS